MSKSSVCFFLLVACGNVEGTPRVDAGASSSVRVRGELVGGSARVTGGDYAVDVTIGHSADQTAREGGDYRVESASPAHP